MEERNEDYRGALEGLKDALRAIHYSNGDGYGKLARYERLVTEMEDSDEALSIGDN